MKMAVRMLLMLVGAFGATAFAQSSGNFATDIQTTQCVLFSGTGTLSGGITGHLMTTTITTPNSAETALLIAPSLVTGLFTDALVDTTGSVSNKTTAVVVMVTLDGNPVPPGTFSHPSVTYEERFQQLGPAVFKAISECGSGNPQCNFDLILTTLSAHSANFLATNPGVGTHTLDVSWALVCDDGSGTPSADGCSTTFANSTVAACVGPGTLTVQQVKAFSQSGGITFE